MLNLNLIVPEHEEQIAILPEDSDRGQRWAWCYLHGEAEVLNCHDVFMASVPKPTQAGNYLCQLQGAPVVAVLVNNSNGTLEGRLVLLSDTDALTHALDTEAWA